MQTTSSGSGSSEMTLQEAFALFRRLGVNADSLSRQEFDASYYGLARRYHPDVNPNASELMANINRARLTIIASYKRA